ncbi:MAG TPA: beta-ketoacyl synthase N-terminal-like domain-containing protein [Myxococcota bacterium]|nr:beta-ketoacyl synthase N-terminal-like domain-containing protein [Myxococcota bacterium]
MTIAPSFISAFTLSSAIGMGNTETVQALREERSGLSELALSPVGRTWFGKIADQNHAAIPDELALYSNSCTRMIASALLKDDFFAKIKIAKERFGESRIACFLGTITSAICEMELLYQTFPDQWNYEPKIPLEYHASINSLTQFTREFLGITGPYATISTACSSSAKVFATAHRYLAAGLCDAAVVAGVEAQCELLIYGFRALGVLSSSKCKPWDKNRDGINIGAAAGFALMTRKPTSPEDFTLRGYGETSDGYHMTSPHPEGLGVEICMRQALSSAGLKPKDIDYINSHGSATTMNDITEDGAITRVFGEGALVTSTKGYTGHTQGAAGITEAILLMLAMKEGFVPANINAVEIDSQLKCQVPLTNLTKNLRFGLTNSMGFGGNNATLIFGAPQ